MKTLYSLKMVILLFISTSLYTSLAGEQAASSLKERERKVLIKKLAHEIIQINEQIDNNMRLRELANNQQAIVTRLKEINTLKTLRDIKIRELDSLRQ